MTLQQNTSDAPLALNPCQVRGRREGTFQLNLPSMQGMYCLEVLTFDTERTLTFACNVPISRDRPEAVSGPYLFPKLDLLDALRSGLLELVEQKTQQVVQLPSTAHAPSVGRVEIPPHPRPGHTQAIIYIVFDTTAQIWKGILHPYKEYSLRLSATGGSAWCYNTPISDAASPSDFSTTPPLNDILPVRREPSMIHFTVYDDPVPPTCSAVFSVASPICHRSGNPQFKFITEITIDASDVARGPVTVGLYGAAFHTDLMFTAGEYIRCVDAATGEEVEFHCPCPCLNELTPTYPEFPTDDWFVELWPGGKPWRHEYTLELEENTLAGGLECLEVGKKYRAELSSDLKSGFPSWMHGRKEDLLRGTTREKRERWDEGPRGRPAISIRQLNEPVEFEVVD